MIKKADTITYICAGIGIIDAIVLSFFLGVRKGNDDCFKDIANKNNTLNF